MPSAEHLLALALAAWWSGSVLALLIAIVGPRFLVRAIRLIDPAFLPTLEGQPLRGDGPLYRRVGKTLGYVMLSGIVLHGCEGGRTRR